MIRTATALVLLVLAEGCMGAKAYERSHLAMPAMQFDEDAQAALLEEHVFTYREGSAGGYGGGGGGCGCN